MKYSKTGLYLLTTFIALVIGLCISFSLFPNQRLTVALFISILVFLLSFTYWLINRWHNMQLRNQLFKTLKILESFDVDEPQKTALAKTNIPMFNELNSYLFELITRIREHYQANKQFTQNASHELQTPLAIVKGHVELLLNSPRMGEKEIKSLGLILQNTNRLSKINSTLILLSKIENQRFSDIEKVDIQEVLDTILENFEDILKLQQIKINKDYQAVIHTEMSATLAEIMLANLLQNAIRYNTAQPYITLQMKPGQLEITNPGPALKVDPSTLFTRFKRQSKVEESLGLGLSIVKRIAELYQLKVSYLYQEGIHTIRIENFS